jgi:hypothetical protein
MDTMPRLVSAAILCLGLIAMSSSADTPPASACVELPRHYQFEGEATAKPKDGVTFRVESVVILHRYSTRATVPQRGETVTVVYLRGGDKFIDVGKRYQVAVWPGVENRPTSGVQTAANHCGGGGTVHADGSRIDTGIRLFELRPWVAGGIAALVIVGLSVVGLAISRRAPSDASAT